MTKLDIIKKISSETGFTNVEVELFLDSFINSVKTSLSKGDKIEIRGFGSFITKKRKGDNDILVCNNKMAFKILKWKK